MDEWVPDMTLEYGELEDLEDCSWIDGLFEDGWIDGLFEDGMFGMLE